MLRQRWQLLEWYERTRRINLATQAWAVHQCDLVFCWFASWHSLAPVLLARLLGKPSVVVIGGYDTANLPEAGYGSQRGGLRQLIARVVIRSATRLITHSYSARRDAVSNAQADPDKITVVCLGVAS